MPLKSAEKGCIGIDFDNTIVTYDQVLRQYVSDHALPIEEAACCKRTVRDYLRGQLDGERQWQDLQAYMYGPGMAHAALIEGVYAFLMACRTYQASVYIVSHKTEYATTAPDGMNLRSTALDWLKRRVIGKETGLSEDQVFFESTRADKVARIQALGCTHFIDDLEETFLEPTFPATVVKIWFTPENTPGTRLHPDWVQAPSWSAINQYFQGEWHGG